LLLNLRFEKVLDRCSNLFFIARVLRPLRNLTWNLENDGIVGAGVGDKVGELVGIGVVGEIVGEDVVGANVLENPASEPVNPHVN